MRKITEALQRFKSEQTSRTAGALTMKDSSMRWDQAIEHVKDQLVICEREVAQQVGGESLVRAELAAYEQLAEKIGQVRQSLEEQLTRIRQAAAELESHKASWRRQLEALRECQLLHTKVEQAEEEIQANAAMVAHLTESQQRQAEELVEYRKREEALQEKAKALRFRFSQALAQTATKPAEETGGSPDPAYQPAGKQPESVEVIRTTRGDDEQNHESP